jgi:hypothetical protein
MPVKIITGTTDNSKGVINENDLVKIKNDFITETDLFPTGGRPNAHKTFHCFLYKEQFQDLFYLYREAPIVKINFALHLNPTYECEGANYSDKLTIVIEAAEDDLNRTPHNSVGDYVLIPAYANKTGPVKIRSGSPCCPSSHP